MREFDQDKITAFTETVLGEDFGVKSVVQKHLNSSLPQYSEINYSSFPLENESVVKEVNEGVFFVDRSRVADKRYSQ